MAGTPTTVEEALAFQAAASVTNGSPLYAALLTGLLADYRAGGLTTRQLDGVSDKPWSDALALRYVATGHRLALAGEAPRLARHYPSCDGSWDGSDLVVDDFLAVVADHLDEFHAGMRRNVQTNEVGRAAVLASGFATIAHRHGPCGISVVAVRQRNDLALLPALLVAEILHGQLQRNFHRG